WRLAVTKPSSLVHLSVLIWRFGVCHVQGGFHDRPRHGGGHRTAGGFVTDIPTVFNEYRHSDPWLLHRSKPGEPHVGWPSLGSLGGAGLAGNGGSIDLRRGTGAGGDD